MEKLINNSIAFLDVFISSVNNQNLTRATFHKSNYTGLLLNFKNFKSFSYKISSIKCLIYRSFKICNDWKSLRNDIENIKSNHIKNTYRPLLIDKIVISFLAITISLKTDLMIIISIYHISATFHTISKINFRNFEKSFLEKILTLN